MRGCRSSAALCVSIASMSIVRHNMPVVLFGSIFATVPLFWVVMRYTIPPLFFVNYVGIVSRHRLCRSTNSYVPRCLVRAISVSADYSIFIRCSLFCDTLRNSPLSRPRDERAMTERWPREKNADFLTQNEQKLHIYAPKFANVAKMYYLCSAQCIGKVIWIVKSTCQKTKYLQKIKQIFVYLRNL